MKNAPKTPPFAKERTGISSVFPINTRRRRKTKRTIIKADAKDIAAAVFTSVSFPRSLITDEERTQFIPTYKTGIAAPNAP
ncbi:MAG TPA: hypothetical protein DDW54_01115 [Clostridiales bacterium]|nr:hypothetical protein [Clostridiales bacterium]